MSRLGINCGHHSSEWTKEGMTQLIRECDTHGIDCYRVNIPTYTMEYNNQGFLNVLKKFVVFLLNNNKYVIWGYTVNGSQNLTSSTITQWKNSISLLLEWAEKQKNKNLEITIFNEDTNRVDNVTLKPIEFQNEVRLYTIQAKQIYTYGKISIADHTGNYSSWLSGGIGKADYYGLNIYGAQWLFDLYIKKLQTDWGKKGYISEFNAHDQGYNNFNDEKILSREIDRRLKILYNSKIPVYYLFGYKFNISGQQWGVVKSDGSYRPFFNILGVSGNGKEYLSRMFMKNRLNMSFIIKIIKKYQDTIA